MSMKRIIRGIKLIGLSAVIAMGTMGARCNNDRGEWALYEDNILRCVGEGNECDKGEGPVRERPNAW